MVRHSSSFFISIVVHLALLLIAYFAWSSYSDTKEEYQEESLCMQLCKIKYEQEAVNLKKEPNKIEKPKKPIEQKTEKRRPEETLENKVKQKPAKKEIAIAEEAPPKKEEIKVEEEAIEELKIEEQTVAKKQESIQEAALIASKKTEPKPQDKIAEPKKLQSKAADPKEEYLKVNTQKISELIRDNLYYPMAARKRGIAGRVSVKFTLCKDGMVSDIEITGSNSDILSRAALRTIEELSGKFPKPGINITLTLPIEYSLR